jgi:biopolymer transport protein ExbD
MRIPSHTAKRRARIEIIPLIDIVFFLLATFVMVSLSMVKNQGVPVKLPKAATGAPQERKAAVTVTVSSDGQIYFEKEKVDEGELKRRLARVKASSDDPQVILNGDERAVFGPIVRILDEARRLGISKVSIQTRPAKEGGS